MNDTSKIRVLISGAGIAGLSLGILLKEKGWEPTIVERDAATRTEGYIIDFFSTGWDVAERMDLIGEVRKIAYSIDSFRYVDTNGIPYVSLPIGCIGEALDGRYTYMQRSDLQRILFEKALTLGVEIRFGTTVLALTNASDKVTASLTDGTEETFALAFGADGVHSRVRHLVFGSELLFNRFLGYYVAAFCVDNREYRIDTSVSIYEEADRLLWVYSTGGNKLNVVCVFRHEDVGAVPAQQRLTLLREVYRGAGWIAEKVLADCADSEPIYFDSATQIVMPSWTKGRVALLGDACACLTLLAGQGSHLAMAEAYVLASELNRHVGDHYSAFSAYEQRLRSATLRKQRGAVQLSQFFVPSKRSIMPIRRCIERIFFSRLLFRYGLKLFRLKSVLDGYQA